MKKKAFASTHNTVINSHQRIAALYCRVSTDAQAEEGYSIEVQQERLVAYCKSQGIEHYDLYIDAGWSGSNLERPEMQRLIRDAKDRRLSHVICYKLDRISRSQRDTLYLIEDVLNPCGISFVSLNETIDTGSPMGRLMIGILSAFAQLERENIRERTQMGLKARIAKGYWPGGDRIPLGYDYDQVRGILVPNDQADLVRQCFKLYLEGHSPQIIADMTGLKYGAWVLQILRRKTYTGQIIYNDEEYEGLHEPIIDMKTFETVQQRIRNRSSNRLTSSKNLLTGLMTCGHCGAAIYYQAWGHGKKKLACYSRSRSHPYLVKDPDCCQPYIDPDELEAAVLEDVFRFSCCLDDKETAVLWEDDERKRISDSLQDLDLKLKRLYGLYASDADETLLEAISDMKKQRKSLAARLSALEKENSRFSVRKEIQEQIRDLSGVWDILSMDEKRNILHIIIESIVITDRNITVNYRI